MIDYEAAIDALARSGVTPEQMAADVVVRRSQRCAFCHAEAAEFLCDHVHCWSTWEDCIEGVGAKRTLRRVMSLSGQESTCDAPICSSCRTQVGVIFDLNGKGSVDTRDVCPLHRDAPHVHLADKGEMTAGEVEHARLRDWKMGYLQRMTGVDV